MLQGFYLYFLRVGVRKGVIKLGVGVCSLRFEVKVGSSNVGGNGLCRLYKGSLKGALKSSTTVCIRIL